MDNLFNMVMERIYVYFTKFTQKLPRYLWDRYIDILPNEIKEKNSHFMRWQDRHSHLFGKLLLVEGLQYFGYGRNELVKLKYNEYDKPYLENDIDFNISHSGKYVLCAIGRNLKLGVDIEGIKEIDFSDFKKVMTHDQWHDINRSDDPTKTFFKYWTIKESIIKADSRGLSVPLLNIHVDGNSVHLDGKTWYLYDLKVDEEYSTCLTTDKKNITIEMIEKDFWEYEKWIVTDHDPLSY